MLMLKLVMMIVNHQATLSGNVINQKATTVDGTELIWIYTIFIKEPMVMLKNGTLVNKMEANCVFHGLLFLEQV